MKKVYYLLFLGLSIFLVTACGRTDESKTDEETIGTEEVQAEEPTKAKKEKRLEKIAKKAKRNYTVEASQLRFTQPTVILSIDDGSNSDFEVNYPYFKEKGIRFTSFINTSTIGKPGFMNIAQVQKMAHDGFDIQDHFHVHVHLNELTAEEIQAGIASTDAWFEEFGLEKPVALAAPYGNFKNGAS